MADVKWIKIAVNIFDNRKIRQIECLPDGDGMIAIWLKILCLAGTVNDCGMIYLTKDIPYTEQMLAVEFNRPMTLIQMAMKVFQQFGMIDVTADIIHVSNWERYQNIEGMERIREQTRQRVAACKERKRLTDGNVSGNVKVTHGNATDIDIDIDIDIDKSNIYDRFDDFWSSYPRKVNKANARKAWDKLKPDDTLTDTIMQALVEHKQSPSWTKDGGQFVPHAATWLNGKRWEDEVKDERKPARRGQAVNHSQRQYSAAELDKIGIDLLDDV